MSIKIVADNCCDLPAELLQRYGIKTANLLFRFGDRIYETGELNNAEFYEKLKNSEILPSTTQPTVDDMMNVYSEALADGSEVIAVHFSSGISGTYQGGEVAKKMLGNSRIYVFDTRKASVGCGLLVLEAARMAEKGASREKIIERLETMREKMQCIFMVGNLEYLIKGGRLSRAKGRVAEVLDIKPILYMDPDGYIMPYDKARGYKGGLKKIINIMEKLGDELSNQVVGISHSASPETAEYVKEIIISRFNPREIILGEVGPVIGSHVGAGTISVFFESK